MLFSPADARELTMKRVCSPSIAAILLAIAPLAAGEAAPAIAAQGESAIIPFAPPTSVLYKVTIARQSGERVEGPQSISYEYRFEPAGEGYRLTITPQFAGSVAFEAVDLPEATRKQLEALVRAPMVLAVSAGAELGGMENEAQYLANWRRTIDALGEGLRKGDPHSAAAAGAFASMMRQIPPETTIAKALENVQPVLEFAGTEMAPGEELSTRVDAPGLRGDTIAADLTIRRSSGTRESAAFSVTVRSDPEQLAASLRPVLGEMVGQMGAPAEAAQMLDAAAVSRERRARYLVSRADGLLDSYRATEIIEIQVSGGGKAQQQRRTTTVEIARIP
jgi:hypothetical protein